MQLSPNSQIPVSYTASIPGDTTVYFVQAVLRDTQAGTTLQTLNLSNVSTTPNRYQGVFNPVSDPSGLGRAIDITISVYTDSGHTTLSSNYQILQLNYTILQPWIQNLGMGGGLNIDYVKLQKMFDGSKVNNSEIGNPEIDYGRIEDSIITHSEGSRSNLSGELKGHVRSVLDAVKDVSNKQSESFKNHEKTVSKAVSDVLDKFVKVVTDSLEEGQKMSDKGRGDIQRNVASLLETFKKEMKLAGTQSAKQHTNMLEKTFEGMQEYIADSLGEKEIKVNYAPEKKKKEPMFAPEHIASLLS